MAAVKAASGPTAYQVADTHNNPVQVKQGQPSPIDRSPTLILTQGGNVLTLTKANFTDLNPVFIAFAATGVLS
jgi:hypothetical protein